MAKNTDDDNLIQLLRKDSELSKDVQTNTRLMKAKGYIENASIAGSVVTKQLILDELWEVYKMCKAAEPVLDREGTPTGHMKFESRSAIKCLELLGKEIGMFANEKLPANIPQVNEQEVQTLATHITNLMTKKNDRTAIIDTTATRRDDEE